MRLMPFASLASENNVRLSIKMIGPLKTTDSDCDDI